MTSEEETHHYWLDRLIKAHTSGMPIDSPAARAGLQPGDIILSMDNETINRVFDVIYHVRQKKPGDTCNIEILRGKEKMTVDVTFFESKR